MDPDEHINKEARLRRDLFDRTTKSARFLGAARSVAPQSIPRKSFIDVEIFDRLAKDGVASAPLSTDAEFLRRLSLDLTGRIPAPGEIREFLADSSGDKRLRAIERLLYSPEFVDKWAMWLGDLFQVNVNTVNVNRQIEGRNKYYDWVRFSIADQKSLKDMVYEAVSARGNTFRPEQAASNYVILGRQVMGPVQDWYDLMAYQAADKFLGLAHYDCLMCHDGRRRLDDLSVWGRSITRLEAQRMSAFFSRTNLAQPYNNDRTGPMFNSWEVSDRLTGNYVLGTTFGNRPNRTIVGNVRNLDPEYRDGSKPKSADWRGDFAELLIHDPLFSVNWANRIWKALFNYGLVEPVNGLDPARLNPDSPPPVPWALQASHPRLLSMLAADLVQRDFNLREFIRLIVESSAYQLSARYDGNWTVGQVALFARHYPRRLEGEEIHDAIAKSTGVFQEYTIGGWGETMRWACQFPDTQEPRSNGAVANFLNSFLRGNRDTIERNQAGSILQMLNLMNDAFVTNRIRVAASPNLRAVSQITDNNAAADQMFVMFLSRPPTESERREAVAHLAKGAGAAQRNAMIEDLAWALINKAEFLLSH